MLPKKNTQIRKLRTIQTVTIIVGMLVLPYLSLSSVLASDEYDCDALTDDDKKEACQKLEKQSKLYNATLKLKQKQASLLTDQITTLTGQVQTVTAQIDDSQQKINDLSQQIDSLDSQINEKNLVIKSQQKILAALMQSYYDDTSQDALLPALVSMSPESGIGFLGRSEYTAETGGKIQELLESITSLRDGLTADKKESEEKKNEIDTLREQLKSQNASLTAVRSNKTVLLGQTQTEAEKYQEMLANIESQKADLFDFSSASNADALIESVSDYDAPDDSDELSTSWYFSQRDSRWASTKIGNTSSNMRDYGCAVSSVAMVFKKFGISITPGKLAKMNIFYKDLINWPDSWSSSIDLVSSTSHGNVSWSEINSQIKKGNPVIIHIAKTNGKGGHYVVIGGKDSNDYIVHDPYFGANLYLKTSRSLVGKIGTDSGTKIDQMIIYND